MYSFIYACIYVFTRITFAFAWSAMSQVARCWWIIVHSFSATSSRTTLFARPSTSPLPQNARIAKYLSSVAVFGWLVHVRGSKYVTCKCSPSVRFQSLFGRRLICNVSYEAIYWTSAALTSKLSKHSVTRRWNCEKAIHLVENDDSINGCEVKSKRKSENWYMYCNGVLCSPPNVSHVLER